QEAAAEEEARQDLRLGRAPAAVALRQAHGATLVSVSQRTSHPSPTPPSARTPACPTRPGRPSLHHPPGYWGRRPALSRRRPWPRPAPGPLARRHHDGGDRPVPGAHRALGDAAAEISYSLTFTTGKQGNKIILTLPKDPAAASISDGDCDAREGESVAMNYKPSPLQVKLEKQRELARKGSLKNGSMGSPVNQQPKKNNVMARTRLVVPNKGYSSLDQSPDEKPLVALDTDSDDDFDMSRYSSSGYSSAEQINQDLNIQLLKDGYRLDEIPDDEDLDLIPPKSVNPTCMCCQATSSTACHIQ
uniref:Family with sequence similarity 219 member A n=2 Tax=Laurasiatheria TaxID=314145 RepID=A0ABI7XG07_FELCA